MTKTPPEQSQPINTAELAREAFKQLAIRRIVPTPDAYRDIFNELAGIENKFNPETVLEKFIEDLDGMPSSAISFRTRFREELKKKDWQAYSIVLSEFTKQYLLPENAGITLASSPLPAALPVLPGNILAENPQLHILRDLLARTLTFAVASLLQDAPDLVQESELMAKLAREAKTDNELSELAARLKQLCFKIEMKSGDIGERQELLLRLFRLLLDNIRELVQDDSWLRGQIESVQSLLVGPLDYVALKGATRSLKEVVYKQGLLKHSLAEAEATVKKMMLTFIDRLGSLAETTTDYHEKIDGYAKKIAQAKDITSLNSILEGLMRDTRVAQLEAMRSRDEMIAAKQEANEAESRIQALENQLEQMSELVREDQLTGSLNRRGLDDVLEREIARSDRHNSPLCVAMLDLDDFKRLNDTYGHIAGDEALIYLVRVIKETLRVMDVIARFGGEEFLIVLPGTTLEDANNIVSRLQRELTKRIFLHNNQRLLITFSAGVALRKSNEDQTSLIKRADEALYKAKIDGKNRITTAD